MDHNLSTGEAETGGSPGLAHHPASLTWHTCICIPRAHAHVHTPHSMCTERRCVILLAPQSDDTSLSGLSPHRRYEGHTSWMSLHPSDSAVRVTSSPSSHLTSFHDGGLLSQLPGSLLSLSASRLGFWAGFDLCSA